MILFPDPERESKRKTLHHCCQKLCILICEKLCIVIYHLEQIDGFTFRRQHPIDKFIADFYCHKAKLVIEVDGDIHEYQKEYDIGRTDEMKQFGLKVIRFTNEDVEYDIESVIERIKFEINSEQTY